MMNNNKLKEVKVLIIDDSAFSRQTIKGILEKAPNIEVVGVAVDGHDGMSKILKFNPDVVTLDLEMPGMDGFTLLRWIMEQRPLPVIVVSACGDNTTVFKALELGAVDFVIKPTKKASSELWEIEKDLLRKVADIASLSMEKLKRTISFLGRSELVSESYSPGGSDIEMVAIGASTGGPAAIQTIVTRLQGNFPGAMIISQHMPRGFTKQFANRMSKISAVMVKEAEHGEPVEKGKVLVCPGGNHMALERTGDKVFVALRNSSTNDRYIPSIDIMMKSASEIYGEKLMGIVLTGMGSDGKAGMLDIKNRGGFTIAESEESSIVFGMPREVIISGGANIVLPLEEIPAQIMKKIKRRTEA